MTKSGYWLCLNHVLQQITKKENTSNSEVLKSVDSHYYDSLDEKKYQYTKTINITSTKSLPVCLVKVAILKEYLSKQYTAIKMRNSINIPRLSI